MSKKLKICEVCGETKGVIHSGNNKFNIVLCNKHYKQMYRHGKILERTRYDNRNTYTVKGDITEITMHDLTNMATWVATIDTADIDKVKDIQWSCGGGYATCRNKVGNNRYMHRIIASCPINMVTDHINGNKLDNRSVNLRNCTSQQNVWNTKKLNTNTSGYKGVQWNKQRQKWYAGIIFNGKHYHLGSYDDIIDAMLIRKYIERICYGEYAYIGEAV